jgi:hypothetical protein
MILCHKSLLWCSNQSARKSVLHEGHMEICTRNYYPVLVAVMLRLLWHVGVWFSTNRRKPTFRKDPLPPFSEWDITVYFCIHNHIPLDPVIHLNKLLIWIFPCLITRSVKIYFNIILGYTLWGLLLILSYHVCRRNRIVHFVTSFVVVAVF